MTLFYVIKVANCCTVAYHKFIVWWSCLILFLRRHKGQLADRKSASIIPRASLSWE